MGSLIWLRNRSRDLIRNNPYAARAIEELAGNVVGTGIVPKAKTGNAAIDKIIDAEWPFFADGLRHAAAPRFLWHADADRPHDGRERRSDRAVPAAARGCRSAHSASASNARSRFPRPGPHDGPGQRPRDGGRAVRRDGTPRRVLAVQLSPRRRADPQSARRHREPAGAGRPDHARLPRAPARPGARRAVARAGDDGAPGSRRLLRRGAGAQEDRGLRHGVRAATGGRRRRSAGHRRERSIERRCRSRASSRAWSSI